MVKFEHIQDGVDAVVIDGLYSYDQMTQIMTELKWLTKPDILKSDLNNLGASTSTTTGDYGASKKGIFLEQVFVNWQHSALMKHCFENFEKPEIKAKLISLNPLYKIFYACDMRTHLLSYYENSDFYKVHCDATVFTILNYFNVEPKEFEGGEVILHSFNGERRHKIAINNNRIILISGNTKHEVTEIKSDCGLGNGRYCNAVFLNVKNN